MQVTTNHSFLRGASHVEELLVAAAALGMEALAVTDRNTLAGIARAHARAEEVGIRLVVGCQLTLRDGLPVLAYPTSRAAYARLCRLLTLGKGRAGAGGCDLAWNDLARYGEGLLAILLPDAPDAALTEALARLRDAADRIVCLHMPRPFLAVGLHYADFDQVSDAEVVAALAGR